MFRLTSTYAIAVALLATCATLSDARGLRGEKNSVPPADDIVDLVDDLTFIDPFEGFDWEEVVPIDDEAVESLEALNRKTQEDPEEDPERRMDSLIDTIIGAAASAISAVSNEPDYDSEDGGGVEGRIVGGSLVGTNEYKPWMVMTLQHDEATDEHFRGACGASMITDQWAVTAAHCISNYRRNDLIHKMEYLYVGAFRPWATRNDKSNYDMPYEKIEIAEIHEHSGHKAGAAQPHDIALLKLVKRVQFNGFRPLSLPNFSPDSIGSGATVTAYGFGQTSYGGSKTEELRKVDLGYVLQETCAEAMSDWEITSDMICAAAPGKDACGGDSGGPLVKKVGTKEVLIGDVSWGFKCAEPGYPGVYSSTYQQRDWMQGVMGSDWNKVEKVSL